MNIFKSFETEQMNNVKILLKFFKVKNILIFKEEEFQEKLDNGYLYKTCSLVRKWNKMNNYN